MNLPQPAVRLGGTMASEIQAIVQERVWNLGRVFVSPRSRPMHYSLLGFYHEKTRGPSREWRGVSHDAHAELTRANDILEAHPEQRLSRSAARAGMAADRFQVSLSPALGPARGLGAGPAKVCAEASRGGPLAPG